MLAWMLFAAPAHQPCYSRYNGITTHLVICLVSVEEAAGDGVQHVHDLVEPPHQRTELGAHSLLLPLLRALLGPANIKLFKTLASVC